MSHEVFTPQWAAAWAEELRQSEAYRKAAAGWEGAVMLEMPVAGESETRAVLADLWHGECRDVRLASAEDRQQAPYVIRGVAASWEKILTGKLDPMFGLMTGKLELTRGSVTSLMSFIEASKELVAAAARIGSTFPDKPRWPGRPSNKR